MMRVRLVICMVRSDTTILGVQRTLSFPICQVIIRHLIPILCKNQGRTYQQQSHYIGFGIGTPPKEPFINPSTVLVVLYMPKIRVNNMGPF